MNASGIVSTKSRFAKKTHDNYKITGKGLRIYSVLKKKRLPNYPILNLLEVLHIIVRNYDKGFNMTDIGNMLYYEHCSAKNICRKLFSNDFIMSDEDYTLTLTKYGYKFYVNMIGDDNVKKTDL